MSLSTSYKYSKDHVWISFDNGIGTIGITDFAQNSLGDVIYVEDPAIGTFFECGDPLIVIESVQTAYDVYSPVSGKIIEINENLDIDPSLVNRSPQIDGWLAKIELSDPSELESLMDKAAYEALNAGEE